MLFRSAPCVQPRAEWGFGSLPGKSIADFLPSASTSRFHGVLFCRHKRNNRLPELVNSTGSPRDPLPKKGGDEQGTPGVPLPGKTVMQVRVFVAGAIMAQWIVAGPGTLEHGLQRKCLHPSKKVDSRKNRLQQSGVLPITLQADILKIERMVADIGSLPEKELLGMLQLD